MNVPSSSKLNKYRLVLTFVALIFYFFLFAGEIYPNMYLQNELKNYGFGGYEKLNPDSLLYIFKRVDEKVTYLLITDEKKKSEYYKKLLEKRYKELVYIINIEKTGFLEETASRYISLVEQMKSDDVYSLSNEEVKQRILILEKLRDNYPSNTPYWLIIQQAIDTTHL